MIKLSLPVQLLLAITFVLLFGAYIPEWGIRLFYTLSILFKDLLSFLLPFMIFSFVYCGIRSFKQNAPIILAILLFTILISNIAGAFVSYGAARCLLPNMLQGSAVKQAIAIKYSVEPWFRLPLCMPIPLSWALLSSVLMGILSSFVNLSLFDRGVYRAKKVIEYILKYGFIPLLPIYVLGFLLKMYYEKAFYFLFDYYGKVIILLLCLQGLYLMLLYALAKRFAVRKTARAIKNALPSYVAAFSTMSSMIALPVSIAAAKRNIPNRQLANMAMPILANIHLLGAAINLPMLALATMIIFEGSMPGIMQYAQFTLYLCTTMFAVSGVPGAGVITLIPLLQSQFNFSSDMISIVTTLYLLLEAFGTAMNAMGDGALIIIVHKILKRLNLGQPES